MAEDVPEELTRVMRDMRTRSATIFSNTFRPDERHGVLADLEINFSGECFPSCVWRIAATAYTSQGHALLNDGRIMFTSISIIASNNTLDPDRCRALSRDDKISTN